jgi:hypothetical protein
MKRLHSTSSQFGPSVGEARLFAHAALAAFSETMSIYCFRKYRKITSSIIASITLIFVTLNLYYTWSDGEIWAAYDTPFSDTFMGLLAITTIVLFLLLGGGWLVGRAGMYLVRIISPKAV